jgi:hypothetical protein
VICRALAVLAVLSSAALASPIHGELTSNIGVYVPAGIVSLTGKVDVLDALFLEGDAGISTAGTELGGGIGVPIYHGHEQTADGERPRSRV